jgi:hypothetical protein
VGVQIEAPEGGAQREFFVTLGLCSASSASGAGGAAAPHSGVTTRCLRIGAAGGHAAVEETFLLEVPDSVARPLARDMNVELRQERLHLGKAHSAARGQGAVLTIQLHDQAAMDAERSLVAEGQHALGTEWLRASAKDAMGGEVGASAPPLHVALAPTAGGSAAIAVSHVRRGTLRLHAHLQRVMLWLDDKPDAAELRVGRSQRGFRSLQLACAGARWQPVVRNGVAQPSTGAGALSGSILGLNVHSGMALEESFVGGMRRETIRSTVQVANQLDFAVQVPALASDGCLPALHARARCPLFGCAPHRWGFERG